MEEVRLGGPLEPLLGAGARDDPVAISEADRGSEESVLLPEVVQLLVELLQLGGEVGIAVDRVYMNAMYPERFDRDEAAKLERVTEITEGAPHAAVRAALSQFRRARTQRDQLKRLTDRVSVPVKTLPFIFQPRLDVPALRRLAEAL
jgi:hypothetical protein